MRTLPTIALSWTIATHSFALSGTVKDAKGAAVAGVALSLVSQPAKTTTSSATGEFNLEVAAVGSRLPAGLRGMEVQGNYLRIAVSPGTDPGPVSLRTSDGRRATTLAIEGSERGVRTYLLPRLARGLHLVQVGSGPKVAAVKLVGTGLGWQLGSDLGDAGLARLAAGAIDTLVAKKDGYATTKTPIESYDQTGLVVVMGANAARSAGCDKTRTLVDGTLSLQSGGKTRKYILKTPATYDKSQAYRLVFAYAESGSSAQSVATRNYFRMAGYDPKGTIFVAPDAENGAGSWSKTDVTFTDDILAQVQGDLCIDKTRIFATGFSFGGAMSIAIACTRADVFRGVAFFSGADLTGSCPTTLTKPIAYYASQASGDASGTPTPTSGRTKQAQFAAVNGCTADANAIVFPAAGKAHTCTVYKNCKAGYPTVYCVFDGPHGWEPTDPGQSTSWNPPEAWKFISQF